MNYHQTLETLKKLQPEKGENGIYGNIGVLLKWQKDILPLLVFSMPLYKKFEEHSRYALDIRRDLDIFRDNDKIRKSHTDAMVKIYEDAVSQLENLQKRQKIKNRFPLLYPLIAEWRPLLQVPVAIITIAATFFISQHFSVGNPPQNKTTNQRPDKTDSNISGQTSNSNVLRIPHSQPPPPIKHDVTKAKEALVGISPPSHKSYSSRPSNQPVNFDGNAISRASEIQKTENININNPPIVYPKATINISGSKNILYIKQSASGLAFGSSNISGNKSSKTLYVPKGQRIHIIISGIKNHIKVAEPLLEFVSFEDSGLYNVLDSL